MLILNNENRVVILNAPCAGAADYLDDSKKIVLHPGANEVANAKWDNFKDHVMVQKFIEIGYIETREKGFESVKSMSVREACDLAKLTVNKPALDKMSKLEDRPAVKAAIKAQLDALGAK